jgi:LmbE family N-acetylglucosaminyl deacetylase
LAAPIVLHFSPHPDDELIGAPATLMALRDAGYRVVNLACGLGRPEQHRRREAEVREACDRAGFELLLTPRPAATSTGDDLLAAGEELLGVAIDAIADLAPRIVVSPSPHDRHHAHELLGRAVRDALRERAEQAPAWWMWGLWASLPQPTLGTAFDRARLEEALEALGAHRGELERNDFRRLVEARATVGALTGPELLFGFGAAPDAGAPFAELLTEVVAVEGRLMLGRPRWLDPASPLGEPTNIRADSWLDAPSAAERLGGHALDRARPATFRGGA